MPVAGMTFGDGEEWLAVAQGGGGHGDPLLREPAAVTADVRAGLVSIAGAARDYGVVVRADGGEVVHDPEATDACRAQRRRERLGHAPSRQLRPTSRGERVSANLRRDDGRLWCAGCGGELGAAGDDVYDALHLEERPVDRRAVCGLHYPGSERFVLRHFHCPHCASQVDVQIGRRDEPLLRAMQLHR